MKSGSPAQQQTHTVDDFLAQVRKCREGRWSGWQELQWTRRFPDLVFKKCKFCAEKPMVAALLSRKSTDAGRYFSTVAPEAQLP